MQGQYRAAVLLQSSRTQAKRRMCTKQCLRTLGQSQILGQVTLTPCRDGSDRSFLD